ncbi:hypothetical protein IQ06DRAFT_259321 [Phaeosphaeriaceae sp. SRC1lsM3a]|nr:hypothetical protein IQ06DRAFT_259321 [Stagonospora sp. SRC1lsM3a]
MHFGIVLKAGALACVDIWQRTRTREDVGADIPYSSIASRGRQGPSTKISGRQSEGEGIAWLGDEDIQQRQVRSTNLRSHPRERDEVKDEVRNGSIGVRDVHTIVREAGNEEGSNGPATGSSNAISLIHHASLLRGTCSGACSWSQFLDFKP